jgi:hypothetical protein
MRRLGLWLCLVPALGCKKSDGLPPWAELADGVAGDGTVTGAPAAVPRLASPPRLDGKPDEWSAAAVLGPLVDAQSGAAVPGSPVAAVARLGWDDQDLYVALVIHDRAPTSPFRRDDPDPHIWAQASGVEIMLQPGDPGDNKDYFELQVDVAGAVFDSHFDDYNAPITGSAGGRIYGHQDFKSHVERMVYVAEGAFWSVEIALPWASLAPARTAIPPRPGDVWRVNLYSFRDGQRQALAWSPLRGQGNFHRTARFGRIRFQ